jgi:hypothetical protein
MQTIKKTAQKEHRNRKTGAGITASTCHKTNPLYF